MYLRRAVAFPAQGKAGAMQDALEDLVRHRQEQGYRASLLRAEISSDFPAFSIETEFDDLDAVEAHARMSREEQRDPARSTAAALRDTARASFRYELYSVRLPASPETASTDWVMRVKRPTLPGRARELGAAVVERARMHQDQGVRVSVLSLMVGPGTMSLVTVYALERLADWESINALSSEPSAAAFFRDEAELQSGQIERELYEVVLA